MAAMQAAVQSEDKTLVVALQKRPESDDPGFDELSEVGTLAVIRRMHLLGEVIQVVVQGTSRVRLVRAVAEEPYPKAEVLLLAESSDTSPEIEALFAEIVKLANRVFELIQPETNLPLGYLVQNMDNPLHYVYVLASIFSVARSSPRTSPRFTMTTGIRRSTARSKNR